MQRVREVWCAGAWVGVRAGLGAWAIASAALGQAPAGDGPACPTYGRFVEQVERYDRPIAVAYANDGRLAVVEEDARRVRLLAADGSEIARIGQTGEAQWSLAAAAGSPGPRAVAFAPDGLLAVACPGRVVLFKSTGDRAAVWEQLALLEPVQAAWRGDELLVADASLGAVVIFDGVGRELGRLAGDLRRPGGVAVDRDGSVLVSDVDLHAILRFDPEERQIGRFGERGAFPGLFNAPGGLAIRGGCLYVADQLNHRVAIFDQSGRFQSQWGMHAVIPREGQGKIHYPLGVSISPDGESAVVVEPFERRIQRFGVSTADRVTMAELPARTGVQSHFGPSISADGDLLLLEEPESASVFVFDLGGESPSHVSTFGGPGTGLDKCGRITALLVESEGQRIVVADPGNGRLVTYRLERDRTQPRRMDPFMPRLVRSYDLAAWSDRVRALGPAGGNQVASGHLEPVGFARGTDRLWTIDAKEGWLVGFDWQLTPTFAVRTGLRGARGLALVSDDTLATCLPDAGVVVLLALDGTERRRFGGPSDTPLVRPTAVARLASGRLAVTDAAADRVALFESDGTFVRAIGERGMSDGEFWQPDGVIRFDDERFAVIDRGNHRAQLFANDGAWQMTFGLGRAYTRPRERGES